MSDNERPDDGGTSAETPVLSVQDLVVEFAMRDGNRLRAVSGISFDVHQGETVGLVGESGCGKSTTAKAVAMHTQITSGRVLFHGADLYEASGEERRVLRTRLQMIWQDAISSLNPRRTVEDQIQDGLRIWQRGNKAEREAKVREIMEICGLRFDPQSKRRRHVFSGGQCQRISIARALVLDPELLICDEVVSALDISVQAQILNLLQDMKDRYGLTMLFISHDLGVIRHVSDRVVVMYLGKIAEIARTDDLFENPLHHYTLALLSSVPDTDANGRPVASRVTIEGDVPSPLHPPSGCRFRTRCPRAEQRCADEEPLLRELGEHHMVACHFPVLSEATAMAGVSVDPPTARASGAGGEA